MDWEVTWRLVLVVICAIFGIVWIHAILLSYLREDAFHFYMFSVLLFVYTAIEIHSIWRIIKKWRS